MWHGIPAAACPYLPPRTHLGGVHGVALGAVGQVGAGLALSVCQAEPIQAFVALVDALGAVLAALHRAGRARGVALQQRVARQAAGAAGGGGR